MLTRILDTHRCDGVFLDGVNDRVSGDFLEGANHGIAVMGEFDRTCICQEFSLTRQCEANQREEYIPYHE